MKCRRITWKPRERATDRLHSSQVRAAAGDHLDSADRNGSKRDKCASSEVDLVQDYVALVLKTPLIWLSPY